MQEPSPEPFPWVHPFAVEKLEHAFGFTVTVINPLYQS
jgi:hypothetical protein